ncbi:MAG TPA: hypothetical protein VFX89_00390 [Gammaproteobacteria bacterium]|nr:hypothetical protein [Gammaproteobacteria bacterium]
MRLAVSACAVLGASAVLADDKAAVEFEEAVAVYGPGIFPAITRLVRCGDYRVLVVYAAGTDLLFLDKLVPADNESTLAATDGLSFAELNYYEASNRIERVSCEKSGPRELRIAGSAFDGQENERFEFSIVVDTVERSYTYARTGD